MKSHSILKISASRLVIALVLLLILGVSCRKKKTNTNLYDESQSSGLSLYKGKDTIYSPAGGSPHGNFKLKFNDNATSKLDGSGKLPTDGSFDNGALIVKEVHSGNEPTLYVVMKKDSKSKYSSKGWLWAEYEPGGKIVYDVSKKGEACTSCHSGSVNRDLTRSFDLH